MLINLFLHNLTPLGYAININSNDLFDYILSFKDLNIFTDYVNFNNILTNALHQFQAPTIPAHDH